MLFRFLTLFLLLQRLYSETSEFQGIDSEIIDEKGTNVKVKAEHGKNENGVYFLTNCLITVLNSKNKITLSSLKASVDPNKSFGHLSKGVKLFLHENQVLVEAEELYFNFLEKFFSSKGDVVITTKNMKITGKQLNYNNNNISLTGRVRCIINDSEFMKGEIL